MTTALVFLAEGAEEMELVITADVLRRAGVNVTIAGLDGTKPVKCSRNVMLMPDAGLSDVAKDKYDLVVIPGGDGGAMKIAENSLCGEILKAQDERGALIGAICAGPKAFISHKIGQGKMVTSYPAFQSKMEEAGFKYSQDRVCTDGHIITSRGPATALDFGLALASAVTGEDMIQKVGNPMLVNL